MPKKKKTREQKIMADKRREVSTSPLYSLSPDSLKNQAKPLPHVQQQTTTISTNSYHYLSADLMRTAVFTTAIILIELALRFFIKV